MRVIAAGDGRVAGFILTHECYVRCTHRDTTVCDECAEIGGPWLVDVLGRWCLCDTTEEAERMRNEITHAAATVVEPDQSQPEPGVMTVTVRDRATEDARWGSSNFRPVTRQVRISAVCPQCGGPRGEPAWRRDYEDGEWISVQEWRNPCGHLDLYRAVLAEARERERAAGEGQPGLPR